MPGRIVILLFLLATSTIRAQQSVLDSLQREFIRHRDDSVGISVLSLISAEYARKDISKAKEFLFQGIALAKYLKTDYALSGVYGQLTIQNQNSGLMDSARYYLERLQALSQKYPRDNDVLANYHHTAGLFYKNKGELGTALQHMLKAPEYMVSPGAQVSKAGQYLNIGNVYLNQGDLRNAAEYHLKALRLFEKLDNKRGQSFCLQSLGSDFLKLKRYDESRKYYEQSLALKSELKDMRGLVSSWIGLGNVYWASEKLKEAEVYYLKALEKARELNLKLEQTRALMDLGLVQKNLNRISSARQHLGEGLRLSRQQGDSLTASKFAAELAALDGKPATQDIGVSLRKKIEAAQQQNDKIAMADAYLNLSDWHFQNKQYDLAFVTLKQYHQLNDSIRGEDVLVQLKLVEQEYQNEKKEKEIALLKKDQELKEAVIEKHQARQQVVVIVMISVFIIAIILFNHYRQINRSKRLIEIEKVRNSIARDLHDDIGSALSSIHIMSQVAMQAKENPVQHLQRISENASRMMESMNDIVWSINPENDSLEQMIIKMKEFASEILEPQDIRFVFEEGPGIKETKLDLDKRKNLFLIYKESINNAAKYSNGTEVIISLKRKDDTLSLSVRDNGKGFERSTNKVGNGLMNMNERARIMNGKLVHLSVPGKGTEVLAELPVT